MRGRAERDELTQLARAGLYAQGKLGREAVAVPVLVEKRGESLYRVEAYEPGDKIHFKTGSRPLNTSRTTELGYGTAGTQSNCNSG